MSWLSSFDPHAAAPSADAHAGGPSRGSSWQPQPPTFAPRSAPSRNPAFIPPRRYPTRRPNPQQHAFPPKPPPTHAVLREEDLQTGESKQAEIRRRRPPGFSEAPPVIVSTKPAVSSKASSSSSAAGKRKAAAPPARPAQAAPRPRAPAARPPASNASRPVTDAPPPTAPRSMREAAQTAPSPSRRQAPAYDPSQRYFTSIPTAHLFSDSPRVLHQLISLAPRNTLCTTKSQRQKLQALDPAFYEEQKLLQSRSARNVLLEEHDARRLEEKNRGKGIAAQAQQPAKGGREKPSEANKATSSQDKAGVERAEKRRRLGDAESAPSSGSERREAAKVASSGADGQRRGGVFPPELPPATRGPTPSQRKQVSEAHSESEGEPMDMSSSQTEPAPALPSPVRPSAPRPKRQCIEVSPEPGLWDSSHDTTAAGPPPKPEGEPSAPPIPPPEPSSRAPSVPAPPPRESTPPRDGSRGKSRLPDEEHDDIDMLTLPSGVDKAPHGEPQLAFEEPFESEVKEQRQTPLSAVPLPQAPPPPADEARRTMTSAQYAAWMRAHQSAMDLSSSVDGEESDIEDGGACSAEGAAGASFSEPISQGTHRSGSARAPARASSGDDSDASDAPLASLRNRGTRSVGPEAGPSRAPRSGSLQPPLAPAPGGHGMSLEDPSGYDYDSDEPLAAARRRRRTDRSTRSASATAPAAGSRQKYSVTIHDEGMYSVGNRGNFLCPIYTESGQQGLLTASKQGRLALFCPTDRSRDTDAITPPPPSRSTARLSTTNVTDAVRLSSKVAGVASRSNVAVGPRMSQVALVFAKDAEPGQVTSKAGLDVMELKPAPHLGGVSSLSPLSGSSSEVSFITGGVDGVVQRWTSGERRTTTQQIHCLHEREVNAVAAMRRHNTVVSSTEGKVIGFDFEHLHTAFSWTTTDRISTLQQTHHADLVVGTVLRSDFDQVKFWDVRQPSKQIARPVLRAGWAAALPPSHLSRVAFHPTRRSLFAIGSEDGRMRLFDVRQANSQALLEMRLGDSNVGGIVWETEDSLSALETERLHCFRASFEDVAG